MRSAIRSLTPWLVATLAVALAGGRASATETQWWSSDSPADYAKAESRGAVIHADGTIEQGPSAVSFADDSLRVAWALAVLGDGSVLIAGDHGRIDRWSAGGGTRPFVRLPVGQVLCLARDGDGVLAGTGPQGLVYRVSAKGDTTRVVKTGERYVWGIVPAGPKAFWAATGTRGRLLRVENGTARIVFDSEESNLVSMVSDAAGGVYVGGDSRGRIYHVSPQGEARTEFDAGEDEARALVRTGDGVLWAAALSSSAVSDEQALDDDKPQPVRALPAGGRATVYRIVPDSATVAWWSAPQPLVYALAADAAGVVAATGNRAGVFRLERVNGASQILAPSQGQVTALTTTPDGAVWAATANPVVLWKLGPGRAGDAELTSAPQDARRFARFGRVRWHGRGQLRISTRSGNTDAPDTTWSRWAALAADPDGGRVTSPSARYLQWKVQLGSPDARLDDIAIAWREPNLPPRVDELTVAPQGQGFRDGEIGARSEAVTQALPGGQKVEYSVSLPSNKPIRELPVWARGLRTLQWRGSDPNGDALRYRIELRREGGGEWVTIGKDLDATLFSWNTNTIPDGRYRLRVTATDAPGNPLGEERTGDTVSEPFTVDNSPPVVGELAADGARIHGRAEDATSPLTRLEVAIDDGDWRTLSPVGGMTDSRNLAFDAVLPGLAPGEHLVSVRAIDMAGNSGTRAIPIQVPQGPKAR